MTLPANPAAATSATPPVTPGAAASAAPERHLRVALQDAQPAPAQAPATASTLRSDVAVQVDPVLALAAGLPIVLTRTELKWTRLADACALLENTTVLDVNETPDDYTPAAVLVDDILVRHGVMRDAGGARMLGIDTDLNRWLLPFLVETTAALAPQKRGIGRGTRAMYGALPLVLSGGAPLPAATVAADLLNTKKDPKLGAMCIWLTLECAAHVTVGGAEALEAALAAGEVTVEADVRAGTPLVAAAELRRAGLLIEPCKPHGVSVNTARNVTTLLKNAAQHARDLGASVPGDWAFRPRKPLFAQQVVRRRTAKRDVRFDEISLLAPYMPVIGQLVIWLEALLGVRISEGFGPLVCDFSRRDGVPYLKLRRQSGHQMTDRDEDGLFYVASSKEGLKTDQSIREVPLAESLGRLIELFIDVFHTDPVTGAVDGNARLIPGLQNDDAAGSSSFRTWLDNALAGAGIERRFTPHALRGSLIQVLREAGISKELRFRYVGHLDANQDIQEAHYNYESRPWELIPCSDAIEATLERLVPVGTTGHRLVSPTLVREQFGVGTRQHGRRASTAAALHRIGWWIDPDVSTSTMGERDVDGAPGSKKDRGRLLSSDEVAQRVGCTPATARRRMREGSIPAVSVSAGKRQVWKTPEADLVDFLATQGLSVKDVAEQIGLSYHQVYELLKVLDLVPEEHEAGTAIRVSVEAMELVRAEVERRAEVHLDAMYVSQAASLLNLSVEAVETLIRTGVLTTVAAPNGARARLIPNAQVESYNRAHPVVESTPTPDDEDDDAVPFGEAARLLGVTKQVLTALVVTRQVRRVKRSGSRHQYVSRQSLEDHLHSRQADT